MPRSIWKGSVSFGLVNIPVRLVSAVNTRGEINFHWIHRPDGSRIQFRRVCAKEGAEVPYDELAKGYEIVPGKYVLFSQEELEALEEEPSHAIEILDFVDLKEIDPAFFDHPYYLVPEKTAGKAYALLLESLKKKGKVGIARVVMRGREYLVSIRPVQDVLAFYTMRFAEEVVPPGTVLEDAKVPTGKLEPRELQMAERLVETLATHFEPAKYHDTYHERVQALIEKKAQGEEIVAAPEARPVPKTKDLLAALEQSIAEAKKRMEQAA